MKKHVQHAHSRSRFALDCSLESGVARHTTFGRLLRRLPHSVCRATPSAAPSALHVRSALPRLLRRLVRASLGAASAAPYVRWLRQLTRTGFCRSVRSALPRLLRRLVRASLGAFSPVRVGGFAPKPHTRSGASRLRLLLGP